MEKLKITFLALLFSVTLSACNQNIVALESIETIESSTTEEIEHFFIKRCRNWINMQST